MNDQDTVVIVESDEGALVLGPAEFFAPFEASPGASRPLSPSVVASVANALGTLSSLQTQSGRWLKMDEATARTLRKHVGTNSVVTGVIRGAKGRSVKHMNFEAVGLFTPAAPAALAAVAAQQAIQASLAEITAYLETIDAKLDRLVKQRKVEVLGAMGGISLAIDEAISIEQQTGVVSSVTWSKVQGNATALQSILAESLAQLTDVVDRIRGDAGDVDDLAKTLKECAADVEFWLGVLARSLAMQDRQYLIELSRVQAAEVDSLDDHREGIFLARQARRERISKALSSIAAEVQASAQLTHAQRVANPFSSRAVTTGANQIIERISAIARRLDIDVSAGSAEDVRWTQAARGLAGDAAGGVAAVAQRTKERREKSILERADRIRSRRAADSSPKASDGEEEGS